MGEFRLLDSGRTKLIWQNIHKWKRFCLNSAVGPLEKITDVSVTILTFMRLILRIIKWVQLCFWTDKNNYGNLVFYVGSSIQ